MRSVASTQMLLELLYEIEHNFYELTCLIPAWSQGNARYSLGTRPAPRVCLTETSSRDNLKQNQKIVSLCHRKILLPFSAPKKFFKGGPKFRAADLNREKLKSNISNNYLKKAYENSCMRVLGRKGTDYIFILYPTFLYSFCL